jgi:hypothetical protein
MKIHGSTYEKGMIKDLSPETLPANAYEDAHNFRLISTGTGGSVGAIHNIKGTKLVHEFGENLHIIGKTQLRDSLLVCVAESTTTAASGFSGIYELVFNFQEETIEVSLVYSHPDLRFTAAYPIEGLAIHETNFIQRFYFSDYQQPTRVINVKDPNLSTLTPDSFSLFPVPPVKKPQIDLIQSGGQLPAGLYQYGYYLITPGGQKTLISTLSNQIHIVETSENVANSNLYSGTLVDGQDPVITSKQVRVVIDSSEISTSVYSSIVLVAFYTFAQETPPTVYEVRELQITEDNTISFVHNGAETVVTLPFEEFVTERYPFYTNKTFGTKDNILFVGNVKTPSFVISDEVAQNLITKRWNKDQQTYQDSYKNPYNDETGTFFGEQSGDYQTWLNNYQYKFQSDGTTLGGESPIGYVKYTFDLEQQIGINPTAPTNSWFNVVNNEGPFSPGLTYNISNNNYIEKQLSFNNFASPYSRFLRGYKRGETYRFGIIFYEKVTNLASPVYYLGDIKFPELSQKFGTEYPNGLTVTSVFNNPTNTVINHYSIASRVDNSSVSKLFTLGIKFDFNFPQEILDKTSYFQIVRVKRTEQDKTRLAQGVVNKFYNINNAEHNQVGGGSNGWGDGNHWEEYSDLSIVMCPVAEMTSVYSHLNRFTPLAASLKKFGLAHLNGFDQNEDGTIANTWGYNNGVEAFETNYYQTQFSTGGLLSFYSPEISYGFKVPELNLESDFLKTIGLLSDTRKRSRSVNNPIGELEKPWGNTFYTPSQFETNTVFGNIVFRPILGEGGTGNNFHKFPRFSTPAESSRQFFTIARTTLPLPTEGTPQFETFEVPENFEKIFGSVEGTSTSLRGDSLLNLTGIPIFKGAFEVQNPFGYWTYRSRIAKDGKSLVVSLFDPAVGQGIRDSQQWFTKGRFVGKLQQFDSGNQQTELAVVAPSSFTRETAFLVEYVRRISLQYGGVGKDAVAANRFITCSDPIKVENGPISIKVFQGDIFVGFYEFMKNYWNNHYTNNADNNPFESQGQSLEQAFAGNNSSTFEVVTIPVETTVNLYLTSGTRFSQGASVDGLNYRAQDTPMFTGRGNDDDGGKNRLFFEYSPVYSEEQTSKEFLTLPVGIATPEEIFDVRAYYSGTKTLGERLDSWSKFGLLDFTDLDTDFGPINRFIMFNDNIYSLQDDAVGVFVINTRELIQGEQGTLITLGTGLGFQDFKYVSTEYGSINQYAVISTPSGVFFLDSKRQKFLGITGEGLGDFSEIKGMSDYFRKHIKGALKLTKEQGGDNPLIGLGPHMVYDPVNKEVWLTVLGNKKGYNLSSNYGIANLPNIFTQTNTGNYVINPGIELLSINGVNYSIGPGLVIPQQVFEDALQSTITPFQSTPNSLTSLYRAIIDSINSSVLPIQGFTLCISESFGVFSAFYNHTPTIYLKGKKLVLSPNPTNSSKLYLHDVGDYGVFYDNDPVESSITIRINSEPILNKILRFIEYNCITKEGETIIQDTGFTAIRIYNDYQDSGKVSLSDRQVRRFRKFRIKVPRDQNSASQLGRFRGTYFDVTLYFDNSVNLSIAVQSILSHLDIQIY